MDPGRLLPTLLRFVSTNPGTVVQVNGHRDLLEPGGARYCAELARSTAGRGGVRVSST